jgi:hypothetical protein
MSVLKKVREIHSEGGVSGLLDRVGGFAYRRVVRPRLPSSSFTHFAGVPINCERKWCDDFVPSAWLPIDVVHQPDYEAGLASGLNQHVRTGDRVVVVGGGLGITAVIAALRAGPSGRVDCFEGSRGCIDRVWETAALSNVTNLTVHHAIVAKSIDVWGTTSDQGQIVPPSHLPPCDVLELDCEGAEVQILSEIAFRPRAIVVETHGVFGAPTSLVASLLEERGYAVSDLGWAEPRLLDLCIRTDVRVLVATQ